MSWKRLSFCLIAFILIQTLFLSAPRIKSSSKLSPIFDISSHSRQTGRFPTAGIRDAALTTTQCDTNFPDLGFEVDRAVKYWKEEERHPISQGDADISWRNDGALKILIHENELRILQTKGAWAGNPYKNRALAVLSQLQEALWSASAGGELLPTIEAAIVVDDMSLIPGGNDTHSLWTFASTDHDPAHQRHWLIPGFSLYSTPDTGSFLDARRRAIQHDTLFTKKIQQAAWRGVRWTNERVRGALIDLTRNQSWADVEIIDWKTKQNFMPAEEMCKYAFVVHTEGRSYSGRLQYLLNCDSVPVIHDLKWRCHYYHLLVAEGPKQNYIPVNATFDDLQEKVKWYLDHPMDAQRIAENSINTFRSRYLSPAATSCYLRRLIEGYSSVAFTPEVLRPAKDGEVRKRRGVAFAEFVHMKKDYDGD